MTTNYFNIDDLPPALPLPDADTMRERLSAIDRPAAVPSEVVEFVVEHAGQRKNVYGVMNIICATLSEWQRVEPDHNWDHVMNRTSLAPEIALAVAPTTELALEGLFLATRS